MKTKALLFMFWIFFNTGVSAQLSNYIFALNRASPSVWKFCKIELSTGNITNYQTVMSSLSSPFGTCIDNVSQIFYINTGTVLKAFNPNTGQQISSVNLPLNANSEFFHMEFNPCDANLYGIIKNNPGGSLFARFNLNSGTFNIISSLGNIPFGFGSSGFIDPDSGIFYFDNGNINAIEISTGQLLYSNPIIDPPNAIFGHIAMKCSNREIYGTSAIMSAGIKRLATLDPYTGVVSYVSGYSWNAGFWKPGGGGDCINQLTGDYFYSGDGSLLLGVSTVTGNLVYNQTINSGDLFGIQHFSDCSCASTFVSEIAGSAPEILVGPNPFTDRLNISTNIPGDYEVIFYNLNSKMIIQSKFVNAHSLNMEKINSGLYFYEIKNRDTIITRGKVLKL